MVSFSFPTIVIRSIDQLNFRGCTLSSTLNRLLEIRLSFSHSFTIMPFLLKNSSSSTKKEILGKNFQSSRNSKNPHPKISSLKKPKNIRIMNLSYGTR
ncbi:hypothetical protein BSQ85_15260 [Enterococcus faecium]|nr:hypothetical protein BSQ85_15260 [Enterococcus faecium]